MNKPIPARARPCEALTRFSPVFLSLSVAGDTSPNKTPISLIGRRQPFHKVPLGSEPRLLLAVNGDDFGAGLSGTPDGGCTPDRAESLRRVRAPDGGRSPNCIGPADKNVGTPNRAGAPNGRRSPNCVRAPDGGCPPNGR